jgi:uncharacterized membrane protein (UPF0127 family)
MSQARCSLLIAVALGLAACSTPARAPSRRVAGPSASVRFGAGTVIIDKGKRTVLLDVQVAQTPEQRARGLMGRRSLPRDAGMVFIFFAPTRGGFWMKDTLIPLSIAFFDRDGVIEKILDMDPCRGDPCRVYDPGLEYWGALEVNRGAFARWRVTEDDVVRLAQ